MTTRGKTKWPNYITLKSMKFMLQASKWPSRNSQSMHLLIRITFWRISSLDNNIIEVGMVNFLSFSLSFSLSQIHTRTPKHTHAHIHTHTYTHIHTHAHAHAHTTRTTYRGKNLSINAQSNLGLKLYFLKKIIFLKTQ